MALKAGLSVSALMEEIATEIAMVIANCWYSLPVMPPMAATGTKTAIRDREVATMGPETSFMAAIVAGFGFRPSSIFLVTASTTTMASSTTMPMASTRPSNESVLMEKPSKGNTAKVPISETGTAREGIKVARTFCRKINTTRITSVIAWNRVITISLMPSVIARVVSRDTMYSMSSGKSADISSITATISSARSRPLAPGNW